MNKTNRLLALWQQTSATPGGKEVFSRLIRHDAPCFASIRPIFAVVEPGHVEVTMRRRRAVLNRVGHMDTTAMCTLAELTGRILAEVSTPATHSVLPRSVTVEYMQQAATDLIAVATMPLQDSDSTPTEQTIPVDVRDIDSALICRAQITVSIAPRHGGSPLHQGPLPRLRDTVFQA